MSRRHNRFQPALSPLEGRVSLSTVNVNSYLGDPKHPYAHIQGTVTVQDHHAHWDLSITDTKKDGSRVRVDLDMALFNSSSHRNSPWAGAPDPGTVNWTGDYEYGFPHPLQGVSVYVNREYVGREYVTWVPNS